MKIRLIITYALNLFDLAATTYWVKLYGVAIEANPIGRWLYQTGLVCPVKIVGMAVLLAVLYRCIKAYPRWEWTSWVVLGVYALLALYHIVIIIQVALIA